MPRCLGQYLPSPPPRSSSCHPGLTPYLNVVRYSDPRLRGDNDVIKFSHICKESCFENRVKVTSMPSNSGEKSKVGKRSKESQAGESAAPDSISRREALKTAGKLAYAAPTLSVLSLVKPAHAFSEPPHPDEYYYKEYTRPQGE